jgi:hypothetical protein
MAGLLEQAGLHTPDIILADISFTGKDGLNLLAPLQLLANLLNSFSRGNIIRSLYSGHLWLLPLQTIWYAMCHPLSTTLL